MNKEKIMNILKDSQIDKVKIFKKLSENNKFNVNEFLAYVNQFANDKSVDSLKRAETVYQAALVFGNEQKNIDILTMLIAKIGESKYVYDFAKNIKGANISVLSNAILKCNNPDEIYIFARNIEGADNLALSRKVAKLDKGMRMYDFAMDIEGADIKELSHGVARLRNTSLIYNFAMNVPGADIEELMKWIAKCSAGRDAKYIYLMSERFANENNVEELSQAMAKTGRSKNIYGFALNIEGANIEVLEEAILKTKDLIYIDLFRKNIKGAKLIDEAIKENPELGKAIESQYNNTAKKVSKITKRG